MLYGTKRHSRKNKEFCMAGITAKFGAIALLSIATAFVSPGIVRAAGPFDGNWVITGAGAGGRTGTEGNDSQACSAFRIPFQIRDNQIIGNYSRSTSTPTEIVASPSGSPMKGSVLSDGAFTLQWEDYVITGKIAGDTVVANWTGQCGARSATGTRVQ